jgi:hypothetical protein
MGAEGIPTNCNQLSQFYFLDEATGDPINGAFAAGNFTTEAIEVNHGDTWQVQAGASGGASGTITLQQSADGVFWDDLPNSTSIPVPLDDSVTFESWYISGRYLRAVYTETTAGNLSLILTEKS